MTWLQYVALTWKPAFSIGRRRRRRPLHRRSLPKAALEMFNYLQQLVISTVVRLLYSTATGLP